jgi:hypothetical protein
MFGTLKIYQELFGWGGLIKIINPALKYKRLHTEYACRKSIS